MEVRENVLTTTAAIVLTMANSTPTFAQQTLEPGQPVVGHLHVVEANLEAQLNHDYNAGIIDPLELANMQRDLDAIKVKEESYRMRSHGMSSECAQRISDRLESFQDRLLAKVSEKGHVATATYVETR
jgi:hypothetical protein